MLYMQGDQPAQGALALLRNLAGQVTQGAIQGAQVEAAVGPGVLDQGLVEGTKTVQAVVECSPLQ